MNRKEKRNLIKANSFAASKCPICKKQSLFATDKDGKPHCILCGEIVQDKVYPSQGFIKL